MKNFFTIIIIVLVLFFGVKVYGTPYSPCDTPLSYKIGSIDPKFGLKESDLLADTNDATGILDKARGSDLFVYSPGTPELTVNFVYDQRTALEENINKQQSQINNQNSTLQQQINKYNSDVKTFEQKLADLNATIQKYNSEGGAPPDVYNQLVEEQNQLRAEGNTLNARATQLNLETHNYNSQVGNLNQNVTQFNQAITQKPEEGQFDSGDMTITIYFVDNKPELIHTLAHEFGHSLGMNHVNDPKAIMYPYTTKYLDFTAQDKDQLDEVCQSYPLPDHWIKLLLDKFYKPPLVSN